MFTIFSLNCLQCALVHISSDASVNPNVCFWAKLRLIESITSFNKIKESMYEHVKHFHINPVFFFFYCLIFFSNNWSNWLQSVPSKELGPTLPWLTSQTVSDPKVVQVGSLQEWPVFHLSEALDTRLQRRRCSAAAWMSPRAYPLCIH